MPPAWNRPGHEQHSEVCFHPSHYISSQPPALTGYQHEDGGGRDVGGRGLPASEDARREGDEHEEEANDEEGDHGAHHVCKNIICHFIEGFIRKKYLHFCKKYLRTQFPLTYPGHLLLVEGLGDVLLVGDVVVEVAAPGLHRRHVELHQAAQRRARLVRVVVLLAEETLAEEAAGAREVERGVIDVLGQRVRLLKYDNFISTYQCELFAKIDITLM